MRYTTPLRYPGGKSKLANFVKLAFYANDLLDGHYVEPYAGGAAVAFALLLEEYASHVHINDIDPAIYAFWHSAIYETEGLCRLINDTRVTMRQWKHQKAVQAREEEVSLLELGFSTFFLNRTNRSGIVTGGVIGGKEQTGQWKLDARYNKTALISRIEQIARFRDRITLYKCDAADFLQTVVPNLPKKTLLYLDPPYFVKGQRRLYANYYRAKDHEQIARLAMRLKQPWLVSYDNVPEIRQLYASFRHQVYDLSYSAADRYRGAEVMFFSRDLKVPNLADPAKLTTRDLNKACSAIKATEL